MQPEAPTIPGEATAVAFARFEGKLDQVIVDHSRRLADLEAVERAISAPDLARRLTDIETSLKATNGKVMGWIGVAVSCAAVAIAFFSSLQLTRPPAVRRPPSWGAPRLSLSTTAAHGHRRPTRATE